ncbi:hypothetical protein ACLOJK_000771 [Asimina triloba]
MGFSTPPEHRIRCSIILLKPAAMAAGDGPLQLIGAVQNDGNNIGSKIHTPDSSSARSSRPNPSRAGDSRKPHHLPPSPTSQRRPSSPVAPASDPPPSLAGETHEQHTAPVRLLRPISISTDELASITIRSSPPAFDLMPLSLCLAHAHHQQLRTARSPTTDPDPAPANDNSTPIKWAISDPATI